MCNSNRSWSIIEPKNKTPGHVFSNNGLRSCAAAKYVLLLLVRFNNSDQFQIYKVIRSYSSHLFLCTLGLLHAYVHIVSFCCSLQFLNVLVLHPCPPGLPTIQFLITYSMQEHRRKAWEILQHESHHCLHKYTEARTASRPFLLKCLSQAFYTLKTCCSLFR